MFLVTRCWMLDTRCWILDARNEERENEGRRTRDKMRYLIFVVLICFVIFCGWLCFDARNSSRCILLQQTTMASKPDPASAPFGKEVRLGMADIAVYEAFGGSPKTIALGSTNPSSGFKFRLELSSKGAAIRKAIFSEFDDRDYKNPQPLVILSPAKLADGSEILSLANSEFVFVQQQLQLALQDLHWRSGDMETATDGTQTVRFEAVIKDTSTDKPVVKLVKIYQVRPDSYLPDSYLLDCGITVENLSDSQLKYRFNLAGTVGIGREAFRADMRKVVAGFRAKGQITSTRVDEKALIKAETVDKRRLAKPGGDFLWAAVTNKYFAAILVPVPQEGKDYCDWIADKIGQFYNPDRDSEADSGDETIGVDLRVASNELAPVGQTGSSKSYNFQLYLGPKDKSLFDKSELYRRLGFFHTIDFMPCFCCPASIINPLAFGILWLMKWMYGFIGNYGVVIIILVFLMRLAMHPITKKSQVSMSKMSKLAPKAEEIRKKYAGNKTEMNKQMMALYREQGATPIMGMLPMLVQMPIWVALWSAIYVSIDLRGKPFLPFWITDLSAPDALIRFSTVTVPLFGWQIESLNLLPLLMGVAFYLQQKLMPSQAEASANPQVAQQQKMMMIMLPLLFPLMLYTAPSGVNLYIMASTFAGVVEQHFIRKHIKEKEQVEAKGIVSATSKTGGKAKKKRPKPFFRI